MKFCVSQSFLLAQNAKYLRVANSTTFTHSDLTAVHCGNCSIEFREVTQAAVGTTTLTEVSLNERRSEFSFGVRQGDGPDLSVRKGGERQWQLNSYLIFRSSKFLVKKTYSEAAPAAAKATVAMRTNKALLLMKLNLQSYR